MIACPVALRDDLLRRGFALRLADNTLRVAPASELTDDDRAAIRQHLPILKALAGGGSTAAFFERTAAKRAETFDPITGRPRCSHCGEPAPADGRHTCPACRHQTNDISLETVQEAHHAA